MRKIKNSVKVEIFRVNQLIVLFDLYYEAKRIGENQNEVSVIKSNIEHVQRKIGLQNVDLFNSSDRSKVRVLLKNLSVNVETILRYEYESQDLANKETLKMLQNLLTQFEEKTNSKLKSIYNRQIIMRNLTLIQSINRLISKIKERS